MDETKRRPAPRPQGPISIVDPPGDGVNQPGGSGPSGGVADGVVGATQQAGDSGASDGAGDGAGQSAGATQTASGYSGSGPVAGQTFNGSVDTDLEKWQAARHRAGQGEMAIVQSDTTTIDGVLLGPNGNPFTGIVAGENGTTRYENGQVVLIYGQPDFAAYGEGPNDNSGLIDVGNGKLVSVSLISGNLTGGKGGEAGGLGFKTDGSYEKGSEAGGLGLKTSSDDAGDAAYSGVSGANKTNKTLPYGNPWDQTSDEGVANSNAYVGFMQDKISQYNHRFTPDWVKKIKGDIHDVPSSDNQSSPPLQVAHPLSVPGANNQAEPDPASTSEAYKNNEAYIAFMKDKIDKYNDRFTPDWVKKIKGEIKDVPAGNSGSGPSGINPLHRTQNNLSNGQSDHNNRSEASELDAQRVAGDNKSAIPTGLSAGAAISQSQLPNNPNDLRGQVIRPVTTAKDEMSYKGGNPHFDLSIDNQAQGADQAASQAASVVRSDSATGAPAIDLSQQINEHLQATANDGNVQNLTQRYLGTNNIAHAAGDVTQQASGALAFPPNAQPRNQSNHRPDMPLAS